MNTTDNRYTSRRRRRTHSTEFKGKVVAACRKPGVSIAAVALANGLNANLVRRWVVAEEQAQPATAIATVSTPVAEAKAEDRAFIPIEVERSAVAGAQEITIELRRGPMLIKLRWPLAAATDCAAWLRDLLR